MNKMAGKEKEGKAIEESKLTETQRQSDRMRGEQKKSLREIRRKEQKQNKLGEDVAVNNSEAKVSWVLLDHEVPFR